MIFGEQFYPRFFLCGMNLKIETLAIIFCSTLYVCDAATFTTTPISDAFVATGPTGNLSNDNFGGGGALAVAASDLPNGEFQSVIEFDLSGASTAFDSQLGANQWTIQSVTLQLTSSPHNNAIYNNIAAGQFSISLMQNNSWVEGTGTAGSPTTDGISFNSLQTIYMNNASDQMLGTFSFDGGSSGANDYALNLTSGVIADFQSGNDLTLRLYAADNNVSYLFSSRTGNPSSSQPELIINAVPEPGVMALCVTALAVSSIRRSFGQFRK
jgi:hypothetical protein